MTAATATKPVARINWQGYHVGEGNEFHIAERLPGMPGCWARIDRDGDDEFTAIIYVGADLNRKQIGGYGGYESADGAKGYVRKKLTAWLDDIRRIRFRRQDVDATCDNGDRVYSRGLVELLEAHSDEGKATIALWDGDRHYKLEFLTACYEIRQRYRFDELTAAKNAARVLLASGPLPEDDGYKRWPGDER